MGIHSKISWCNKNGITIYPVPINEFYFVGKRKINYVNIEININGKTKIGKGKYKQDLELREKIKELYNYLKKESSI